MKANKRVIGIAGVRIQKIVHGMLGNEAQGPKQVNGNELHQFDQKKTVFHSNPI
jgi:hypothetical protein